MSAAAWVYLLRCADGSLYCGWTVDLDRRLARHAAGTASAYTRSRRPVALALALPMPDRTAARREEARIKALSRPEKLALVGGQTAPGPPSPSGEAPVSASAPSPSRSTRASSVTSVSSTASTRKRRSCNTTSSPGRGTRPSSSDR
jgi:putative endonuclease